MTACRVVEQVVRTLSLLRLVTVPEMKLASSRKVS